MVSNDNVPLITTETLQYRLDTQNFGKSSGQRSSLTRCAQKYGDFRAQVSSTTPDREVIAKSKNELVREVELFDIETTKLILWQQNLERQAIQNKAIDEERKRKIESMKDQVRESTAEATRSLEQRNCLSEYESLAKLINKNHPMPSTELEKQIGEIRNEISSLEEASEKKDEIIKVREAQYQLLIQYMMDLKQSLEEDGDDSDAKGDGEQEEPQPMDIDNLYGDL